MNQSKESVKGVLCLPITEAAEKKIGQVEALEATVIQNGLVMMKSQMTVVDVLKTLEGLEGVMVSLYLTLAKAAGVCKEQSCYQETEEAVNIKLPEFILEEAGIPKDAKLCAYANEGSGEVIVMEADYKYDLSDVPSEILKILKTMNVCLPRLNECMMSEIIIYGKQK